VASLDKVARVVGEGEEEERNMAGMVCACKLCIASLGFLCMQEREREPGDRVE
jgi:hypothetical protein